MQFKDIGTHVIYSDGRIFKKSTQKFIGHSFTQDGYPLSCINGKQVKLHQIIANAFLVKEHESYVVNHKNGIKTDNRVENLEWVSQADNVRHAFKNGLMVRHKGSKNHQSILKEDQVLYIKQCLADKTKTMTQLCKEFGVTIQCIWLIKTGKNWGHLKIFKSES